MFDLKGLCIREKDAHVPFHPALVPILTNVADMYLNFETVAREPQDSSMKIVQLARQN